LGERTLGGARRGELADISGAWACTAYQRLMAA
jgi:hypothetical protein